MISCRDHAEAAPRWLSGNVVLALHPSTLVPMKTDTVIEGSSLLAA
jgi:hypothetical protein